MSEKAAPYYMGEFIETLAVDGDTATIFVKNRDGIAQVYSIDPSMLPLAMRDEGPHPQPIAYASCGDCGCCRVNHVREFADLTPEQLAVLCVNGIKREPTYLAVDDSFFEAPDRDSLEQSPSQIFYRMSAEIILGAIMHGDVRIDSASYRYGDNDPVAVARMWVGDTQALYNASVELLEKLGMPELAATYKTSQWMVDNTEAFAGFCRAMDAAASNEELEYSVAPTRLDDLEVGLLHVKTPTGQFVLGLISTNELDARIS